jgi:hypothetical protein
MEAGLIALIAITAMVVGAAIGVCLERARKLRRDVQGILYIDYTTQTTEPSMFLAATIPPGDIASRKYTTFEIDVIK